MQSPSALTRIAVMATPCARALSARLQPTCSRLRAARGAQHRSDRIAPRGPNLGDRVSRDRNDLALVRAWNLLWLVYMCMGEAAHLVLGGDLRSGERGGHGVPFTVRLASYDRLRDDTFRAPTTAYQSLSGQRRRAADLLRVPVSKLRKALGEADRVVTSSWEYAPAQVGADECDSDVFERLAADGIEPFGTDHPRSCVSQPILCR